ncbi:MAG: tripartite tricarboxylate transporter substrate-binding protein [Hyphomicrobiales bacterium]
MRVIRTIGAVFLAAFMAALVSPAAAQSYLSKPVHIVVPFAAGGITDILARALAQRLTESLGQQFVVENKVGGAGHIGIDSVAKAPPDGYTLLVGADASLPLQQAFL